MGAQSHQELKRELELLRTRARQEVFVLKEDLNVRRRMRSTYQAHRLVFVLGAAVAGFALGWIGTARRASKARRARASFWSAPPPPPPPKASRGNAAWAVLVPVIHSLVRLARPLVVEWAKEAMRPRPPRSPRPDGTKAAESAPAHAL